MSTPIRKCGLVFHPSLSLINEDHNKEYPLTKVKQFAKCSFGEIFRQSYLHRDWMIVILECFVINYFSSSFGCF